MKGMYTLESVIPVICAGLSVCAVIAFIVYCGGVLDEEAARVGAKR